MFYAHEWWYQTAAKGLATAPDADREERMDGGAAVVFYHAEEQDEAAPDKVLQKFVKNVKWLAGKFDTRQVVLHSFNHLGTSKASAEFTHGLLLQAVERFERVGFTVMTTPFGYFNEFRIHVAGDSLAKVYKEF